MKSTKPDAPPDLSVRRMIAVAAGVRLPRRWRRAAPEVVAALEPVAHLLDRQAVDLTGDEVTAVDGACAALRRARP